MQAITIFITVLAAVCLCLLIREIEDMRKLLLDRGDAARVLAVDHIGDLFRKLECFFSTILSILDDVDSDTCGRCSLAHPSIYQIQAAVDLDDVLAAHLVACAHS